MPREMLPFSLRKVIRLFRLINDRPLMPRRLPLIFTPELALGLWENTRGDQKFPDSLRFDHTIAIIVHPFSPLISPLSARHAFSD